MKIIMLVFSLLFFNCLISSHKIKKNKNLRNLLKVLTERVETTDGFNEFARLTQSPKIEMKLHKTKYTTSLQNILVNSYSEKTKELVGEINYQINKEKQRLEELENALYNINKLNYILEEKSKIGNKLSKYYQYLNDNNEWFNLYPQYKTFISKNKFITNINMPIEILEKAKSS